MKPLILFLLFNLEILAGCISVSERSPPAEPAIATITGELQAIAPSTSAPVTATLETAASSPADASADDTVEPGLVLYKALYCGLCHELQAANTKGIFGPPHNGIGAIAAQRIQDHAYSGQATTAEEYLLESLVQPEIYVVEGYAATHHRMPTYAHLTPHDLDAVVQFLLQQ